MVDFEQDILACLTVLRRGGLILYPTDTIWGIGCDATNEEAVKKVFALKQREDAKSLIVLVADERDILQYVAAPDMAVFDYLDQQAKPVTVIYSHAIGLAENVLAADGSAGIRICKDNFCRHLLKRFRKPLVSTSANISGQPPPQHYGQVPAEIKAGADFIVSYRQQDRTVAAPSSVIRWNENGTPDIIRP